MITASLTLSPRYASASVFNLPRIRAEISCAVYFFAVNIGGPIGAHMALDRSDVAVDVGHRFGVWHLPDQHLAVWRRRRWTGSSRHLRRWLMMWGLCPQGRRPQSWWFEVDSDSTGHHVCFLLQMWWYR